MKIDIQIDDRQVLDALSRLAAATEDLSPAMRDIALVLEEASQRAFETESDPSTGQPWAPLNESTQRKRLTQRGDERGAHPILQVTGVLSKIVADYGRDFAVAGTSVIYGATHQFGAARGAYGSTRHGSPIPWGDVPPRPFLGIDEGDRNEILEIIARHLTGAT